MKPFSGIGAASQAPVGDVSKKLLLRTTLDKSGGGWHSRPLVKLAVSIYNPIRVVATTVAGRLSAAVWRAAEQQEELI